MTNMVKLVKRKLLEIYPAIFSRRLHPYRILLNIARISLEPCLNNFIGKSVQCEQRKMPY